MEQGSQQYTMLEEAFEHLWKGRFRLALPLAERLISENPHSADAAICYAWASLENGDPAKAEEYIEKSRQSSGQSLLTQLYRGYVQMRLSSFEAAIYDFNMTEGRQKELLAWTYLNKAKSLASIGEIDRAVNFYELGLMIDNNANPSWKALRKYFSAVKNLLKSNKEINLQEFSTLAKEALSNKEYWFALIIADNLLKKNTMRDQDILLIQLEAMYRMNQFPVLEQKLKEYEKELSDNDKYASLAEALRKIQERKSLTPAGDFSGDTGITADLIHHFENGFVKVESVDIFNAGTDQENKNEVNLSEISINPRPVIGVRILVKNLNHNLSDVSHHSFFAWFVNDDLIEQSSVSSDIPSDWDMYTLPAFVDTRKNPLWRKGQARLDFFINRKQVFSRYFTIGDTEKILTPGPEEALAEDTNAGFREALDELNSIIGLSKVKESVRSLIDYLEVMNERKSLGLKAQDKLSVHATFLGNPGTGKTTVARLMGKIFRGMGLLPKGEVIEVDRAALVGQYVGETAQKTEKIIEDAMGNVLFIDEAYTLVKKGQSNDFGQEAIDVLLKRMEDKKGEFFVIAAGYPDEMNDFLEANPGLKSRFTHHFNFEDYTPDEMMEIYRKMVSYEEYRITEEAEKQLYKEFVKLYRGRDKNFGNARTVKKSI